MAPRPIVETDGRFRFPKQSYDDAEAYTMQDAANQVADALRKAGYAPR